MKKSVVIVNLVKELDSSEDLQEVIQGIANYLTEAYEACGDESWKEATLKLMDAYALIGKVSGR